MDEHVGRLLAWCEHGGAVRHGIRPGLVEQGWRGILATRDIAPGETVLEVPEALLMTWRSALACPRIGNFVREHPGTLDACQALAIHLLAEAASGPASKWAPYIRTLPGSYTAACSFTEHDLEALHGFEVMQGKIRAAGTAQREAWRGARPALQALFPRDAKWRSLGAWLWAAATLSTRTMYMPGPGDEAGVALWGLLRRGEDPGALTPLGDFHNYAPPPAPYMPAAGALAAARGEAAERREEAVGRREEAAERREEAAGRREEDDSAELEKASAHARASAAMGCSGPAAGGTGRFDVERRVYCLLAGPAGVRTGDQVFLDYGRYDNEELLVLYGFVLRDNPHDRVLLGAGSFPAAAAAAAVGDLDPADRCLVCSGAPGWSLLRALRLAAATAEERRKGAWLALDDRPISVAGDALVATWLCAAAAHVQAGIRRALCRADQQPEQSPSPCAAVAREWLEAQLSIVERTLDICGAPQPASSQS